MVEFPTIAGAAMMRMTPLFAKSIILCVTIALYLFLYLPLIVLVVFSFNKASFPAPWVGFTWEWYQQLLTAHQLWQAVLNSFIIATSASFISLLCSLTIVLYLGHKKVGFASLLYSSIFIPEVILAVALLSFFTFFCIPLGITTLIIAHAVLGIGYALPIIFARYQEIDQRLIEASLDLGATTQKTFFKITLPLLMPAVTGAGLLVFILSFDNFILSYFCAGDSSQTISLYILSILRSGVSPLLNAFSTFLLLLSSVLVLIICWVNSKVRLW